MDAGHSLGEPLVVDLGMTGVADLGNQAALGQFVDPAA